ncbi:putative blastopia polyprotein [Trichonephila clavipes]|nr:putative blastopia polyprotein [Trichonephila clavipes]
MISETHSLRRKLEKAVVSSANKKARRKVSKSMENLPRIAYQMEYFQLEMMFLSLQAPIMIPVSVHKAFQEIDFLKSIILDAKLKEPNKSKAQFDKKRKQPHIYKKDELVTMKRTQFGTRLKLRPMFYRPCLIKTVKLHDRNEIEKVSQREGPHLTSTAIDFLKKWSTADP